MSEKIAATPATNIIFGQESRQYREHALVRDDLPAGAFEWMTNQDGKISCMAFVCPCGCHTVHAINVGQAELPGSFWRWDGNKERPTLTPSILRCDVCRWHGFLTNGEWITC